mgnify:CR=1 FL=1
MFIKYDEIELMEFFESEPIFIGDEEAGECMYVRRQGDFKIILVISTYEMYIKVSVHSSISGIERIDKNTLKVSSDNHDIVIINAPQIGVFVEE